MQSFASERSCSHIMHTDTATAGQKQKERSAAALLRKMRCYGGRRPSLGSRPPCSIVPCTREGAHSLCAGCSLRIWACAFGSGLSLRHGCSARKGAQRPLRSAPSPRPAALPQHSDWRCQASPLSSNKACRWHGVAPLPPKAQESGNLVRGLSVHAVLHTGCYGLLGGLPSPHLVLEGTLLLSKLAPVVVHGDVCSCAVPCACAIWRAWLRSVHGSCSSRAIPAVARAIMLAHRARWLATLAGLFPWCRHFFKVLLRSAGS